MSYHDLNSYQKKKFMRDLKILKNDLESWGFEIITLSILFVPADYPPSTHNESVNVQSEKRTPPDTITKKAD